MGAYFPENCDKTDKTGAEISDNLKFGILNLYLLICVEVIRPSQPNGVMSSAVSLLNHTFTGQA